MASSISNMATGIRIKVEVHEEVSSNVRRCWIWAKLHKIKRIKELEKLVCKRLGIQDFSGAGLFLQDYYLLPEEHIDIIQNEDNISVKTINGTYGACTTSACQDNYLLTDVSENENDSETHQNRHKSKKKRKTTEKDRKCCLEFEECSTKVSKKHKHKTKKTNENVIEHEVRLKDKQINKELSEKSKHTKKKLMESTSVDITNKLNNWKNSEKAKEKNVQNSNEVCSGSVLSTENPAIELPVIKRKRNRKRKILPTSPTITASEATEQVPNNSIKPIRNIFLNSSNSGVKRLHIRFEENEDNDNVVLEKQSSTVCSEKVPNECFSDELYMDDVETEETIPEDQTVAFDAVIPAVEVQLEPKILKCYDNFPDLEGPPRVGDIIAFKELVLSESYTPEISPYREGVVTVVNSISKTVNVKLVEALILPKNNGRFSFEPMNEFDVDCEPEKITEVTLELSSLLSPKLCPVGNSNALQDNSCVQRGS